MNKIPLDLLKVLQYAKWIITTVKTQRKRGVNGLFLAQSSALQPYLSLQTLINLPRIGMYAITGVGTKSK